MHRVGLVKKQATAFFSHPLFSGIVHTKSQAHIEHARFGALQCMKRSETAIAPAVMH